MLSTDNEQIPVLANAVLSADCFGLTAQTKTGEPASLAIVDGKGEILESGEHVAKTVWLLMLAARNNYLIGKGYLRVLL